MRKTCHHISQTRSQTWKRQMDNRSFRHVAQLNIQMSRDAFSCYSPPPSPFGNAYPCHRPNHDCVLDDAGGGVEVQTFVGFSPKCSHRSLLKSTEALLSAAPNHSLLLKQPLLGRRWGHLGQVAVLLGIDFVQAAACQCSWASPGHQQSSADQLDLSLPDPNHS